MINTIKDKIKELLDTIPEIKGIYECPENNPTGYPCAWAVWEGNESDELNNSEDRVTLKFMITLVQEKLEDFKGRKNAEIVTNDRAWKIEELFRKNNSLDLTNVLRVLPVETTKSYDASATRIILNTLLRVQIVSGVTL
jgi:hypothetical protein